jgi:hypothetical protein
MSSETHAAGPGRPSPIAISISGERRARLRTLADGMIPAAHGMPSAGEIGVSERQLDLVLAARPDLAEPLARALELAEGPDWEAGLAAVEAADKAAHDALLLTVVGAYYIHPQVRRLLRYDGQVPVEVRPEIIPNYVEEGLIEPLLERGPAYREVPGAE